MIEVDNLVYEYPAKRALDGVSLTVRRQTITALVGPNGAGKTTLMRCLATLDAPYSGTIRIAGLDTRESPRAIHEQLGYLSDFFGLYDALSVRQCLNFAARAHGLKRGPAEDAAAKAAVRVGLADRMASPAAELSRGMRQRLAIGQAIVHEPKVLLLDEPAAGLDPLARRDLSKLLVMLKHSGMTLLVSSHILSELEDYSDEMIIMDEGRIAGGAPKHLKGDSRSLIRVELASARGDLSSYLAAQAGVEVVEAGDAAATLRFLGDAAGRAQLLRRMVSEDFAVIAFADAPHQLEEAYFAEVNKGTVRP